MKQRLNIILPSMQMTCLASIPGHSQLAFQHHSLGHKPGDEAVPCHVFIAIAYQCKQELLPIRSHNYIGDLTSSGCQGASSCGFSLITVTPST